MHALTDASLRLVQTLPEDPYLDAGLRGFIINTARREFWRVAEVTDLADLVQDGILCYWKCRKRYVEPRGDLTASAEERKWFQALVKTTFMNHISSLAAKHKGVRECLASEMSGSDDEGVDVFERNLPSQPELGTLAAALSQAPWELAELLRLMATDAVGFVRVRKSGRRALRETTNEYYCRLLGVCPAERDLVRELQEHFG